MSRCLTIRLLSLLLLTLTAASAKEENGKSLLEKTSVLYGSNLGNASSHSWRNLPIILAGGGYRHGSYVAHDPE